MLELDSAREPTLTTGTHLAVNRILWASGYHVPRDSIGTLRREQLVPGHAARFTGAHGREHTLTEDDIDRVLARGAPPRDGQYRALFSELVDGEPLGGFPQEGVRPDDPNDRVPHEQRRELRGLSVIAGWLQHTDMSESNTLDVYVADPERAGVNYVRHYLIDFDKSLGVWGMVGPRAEDGHTELLDGAYAKSAFTLGLWRRPWEGTPVSRIDGVAMFDAEHYHPDKVSPWLPYAPFLAADEQDMLWGIRIMLAFDRDHLRAALTAAQFADAAAVDYLTEVLIARRTKAARHWLARVSSIVDVEVRQTGDRAELCFDDLELSDHVAPEAHAGTRYRLTAHDFAGRALRWRRSAAAQETGSRRCIRGIPLARPEHGYTIVRIETWRGRQTRGTVEVHLARPAGSQAPRVIGIRR